MGIRTEFLNLAVEALTILLAWNVVCPQSLKQLHAQESVQLMRTGSREQSQELLGAASCAGASCHGGPRVAIESPTAPRGSEYSLWLQRDPHSRSWQTMCSDSSKQILTKLGILQGEEIVNQHAYRNCLACHNTDHSLAVNNNPSIMEGVGCESCHGNSKRWIDRHFQDNETKRAAKDHLGLIDLESLITRAKSCTVCHVGASDRDMNHDIIAAGHPALYFDMAVYSDLYPRHWRDSGKLDVNARSRMWMAGQFAAACAELDLLESRLTKRNSVSVWPELSNYACAQCHVALDGIPKSREQMDRLAIAGNSAPPRKWYLNGVNAWSELVSQQALRESLKSLYLLTSNPHSNAEKMVAETRHLRALLISSVNLGEQSLATWSVERQRELARIQLEHSMDTRSWETAAGAYIATWATLGQERSHAEEKSLSTLRRGLLFPMASQSPIFPRKPVTDSPPSLAEWNESLQSAAREMLRAQ